MKKLLLTGLAMSAFSIYGFGQTIAKWTFETSLPAGSPGAGVWITNIAAEVGSGTASGWHAGAATYSNPAGNGSAESFSSATWAVGDLYQFTASTVGLSGIGISYDQTSSTSGPGFFDLKYSTDGVNFTTFASSIVVQSNAAPNPVWNSTTASSLYSYSFDLSSVSALNNASTVYFQLVDSSTASAGGGTPSAAGSSRLDNVEIFVVPEPSTFALTVVGGLLGLVALRRKRN
jgi:hypothetical protein